MLLEAMESIQNPSRRSFSWQQQPPKQRRKRKRGEEDETVHKKRRRSPLPNKPAELSWSRKRNKRKRTFEVSSSSESPVAPFKQRKKRMLAFENGAGVGGLEEKLDKLKIGKIEEKMEGIEVSNKSSIGAGTECTALKHKCTAIVPVVQRDFRHYLKDVKTPSPFDTTGTPPIFTIDHRLKPRPPMDPKEISSSVLEVLVQLGFVEKVDCWGQDFYVVLKERFEPIFQRPTNFYFQNVGTMPKLINRFEKTKKTMDTKTLVGLWLLLVKLGYFLNFPEVKNYTRILEPVNESRLAKLGSSWLKQLGITEEMLTDPVMMDVICKKIVEGLRQGKGKLENGDANDEDEKMIEAIS